MFATTLSALYGKILVVMGIAFPMAEVISSYVPPSFYEVFRCSLCTSLTFLTQSDDYVIYFFSCGLLAGLLFVSIRRQYDIFVVYVCHADMGQTETHQNPRYRSLLSNTTTLSRRNIRSQISWNCIQNFFFENLQLSRDVKKHQVN